MLKEQEGACGSAYCTSGTSPGVIYNIDFQGRARELGISLKQSLQRKKKDILDGAVIHAGLQRGSDSCCNRRGRRLPAPLPGLQSGDTGGCRRA